MKSKEDGFVFFCNLSIAPGILGAHFFLMICCVFGIILIENVYLFQGINGKKTVLVVNPLKNLLSQDWAF